jgi:hypothetical protein
MLPRFFSSCTNLASAKATRRSKPVLNVFSPPPPFGLRAAQNFSTNSARSPSVDSCDQVFFSSADMSQTTGPSAQVGLGGSLMLGGGLYSW